MRFRQTAARRFFFFSKNRMPGEVQRKTREPRLLRLLGQVTHGSSKRHRCHALQMLKGSKAHVAIGCSRGRRFATPATPHSHSTRVIRGYNEISRFEYRSRTNPRFVIPKTRATRRSGFGGPVHDLMDSSYKLDSNAANCVGDLARCNRLASIQHLVAHHAAVRNDGGS